jgi:hypothetical protein
MKIHFDAHIDPGTRKIQFSAAFERIIRQLWEDRRKQGITETPQEMLQNLLRQEIKRVRDAMSDPDFTDGIDGAV